MDTVLWIQSYFTPDLDLILIVITREGFFLAENLDFDISEGLLSNAVLDVTICFPMKIAVFSIVILFGT
jgi:hypothetical protein